jgi:putative component of membrane protein insertase Oxa1/YidC/SpoIIIJ protein YidD
MAGIKFHKQIRNPSAIEEMPSQFEQENAESYCFNREIFRPDTDIKKVGKYVVITFVLSFVFTTILNAIISGLDIFSYFPSEVLKFKSDNPRCYFLIFYLCLNLIIFVLYLRKILIGIVRLYQYYASEEVRRRCLFKPTCSEYTILVLQKYGVIIGLYKAYIRIFKKCKGNIYRIDYP